MMSGMMLIELSVRKSRKVYFATYRGSFIAPEPSYPSATDDLAA